MPRWRPTAPCWNSPLYLQCCSGVSYDKNPRRMSVPLWVRVMPRHLGTVWFAAFVQAHHLFVVVFFHLEFVRGQQRSAACRRQQQSACFEGTGSIAMGCATTKKPLRTYLVVDPSLFFLSDALSIPSSPFSIRVPSSQLG